MSTVGLIGKSTVAEQSAGDQRLRVASMIMQKIPIESNVTLLDLTIPYFPSLSCNLSVLHVIFYRHGNARLPTIGLQIPSPYWIP
jgi:hypothetical protein